MANAAAQTGDNQESDSAIIQRHNALIRSIALPFVSRGVELDDLMQIGRIALLGAIASWRKEAALWTYARKSVLRDMIRYVSNEIDEPSRPTLTGDVADAETGQSPDDVLETAECVAITNREMVTLTAEECRVLRMRFVDDTDVRTIANSLGVSKSEVDRTYHRAIAKLKERVEACV